MVKWKNITDYLDALSVANFDRRTSDLQKAVESGWYRNSLLGAAVIGYTLTTGDSKFSHDVGNGILVMDLLHSFILRDCF